MNPLRKEAFKLRLQGYSYNEIHAKLGIPKSTQNVWFRHLVLSDMALARLKGRKQQGVMNGLVRRNKLQTHHARARAQKAQMLGKSEVSKLTAHDLRILGVALYWAEGYKRVIVRDGKELVAHPIRLVNADPEMIQVFIRFLTTVLTINSERIIVTMRLFPHINEQAAYRYWMHITDLPREQFRKTLWFISSASKKVRPYNRLPWGTLEIQVSNTHEFHRLMGMIEGVKKGL
jgi:hypothetical protein